MAQLAAVLHEVWTERERQDIKWGGSDHDDEHSMDEWRQLIQGRIKRVPLTRYDDRRLLIEVAALAVAAIQTLERQSVWEPSPLVRELTG